MYMAERGSETAVRDLVAAKADVNSMDNEDRSALMLAAMGRKPEHGNVVRILVDAGATLSERDQVYVDAALLLNDHGTKTGK